MEAGEKERANEKKQTKGQKQAVSQRARRRPYTERE